MTCEKEECNYCNRRRLCFVLFCWVLLLFRLFFELDIDYKEMVHLISRSDDLYFPRHFHQRKLFQWGFGFTIFQKASAFSNLCWTEKNRLAQSGDRWSSDRGSWVWDPKSISFVNHRDLLSWYFQKEIVGKTFSESSPRKLKIVFPANLVQSDNRFWIKQDVTCLWVVFPRSFQDHFI